jgi:hypothetical protein
MNEKECSRSVPLRDVILRQDMENWPFLGDLPVAMVIFNSYVKFSEGVTTILFFLMDYV